MKDQRLGLHGSLLLAFALFVSLLSVSRVSAQTIVNPNFANPTLAPGQYTTYGDPATVNTIPGWTNPDIAGVQNFSGTGAFISVPGETPGNQNAAYDDGGTIAQILTGPGSTLSLGTYTLTVQVGNRIGKSWPGGSFGLYTASGTLLDSLSLVEPASGTFTPESFSYAVLPGNAHLGAQMQIELISNGNSTTFSDVSLAFSPAEAPEPSTYALVVAGLAFLGLCNRRKFALAK